MTTSSTLSSFMNYSAENAPTMRARPMQPPANKAADGFINISIVDANGVTHRINVVIPLHNGLNRKLDEAILAKVTAYELAHAEWVTNKGAKKDEPAKPTFNFVGDVVLVADKAEPTF